MKKNLILMFSFLIAFALVANSASAQITINIPNLPKILKIKKPKVEQPRPEQVKTEQPTTDDSKTSDEPRSETTSASTKDCESDAAVRHHLGNIKKTRQEAEEFRPGLRDYYVSTLNDGKNVHLESALSPSKRKDSANVWQNSPEFVKCINPALDQLAAAARKTLPTYSGPAGYTFGTPAEKKALLTSISDIGNATVFKVGLQQANWMIAKDAYNFPTSRYKYGVIYAKYPGHDDGFCRVFWVNLVQDYAGGGTYGASYGSYIERSYAGCPAGAK